MFSAMRDKIHQLLRWSEKYTKTDMVYLVGGHFWFFVGRAFAVGSGFLLTVGFANLMSPTDYGTYKYILAGAGMMSAFTLGGSGGITSAIQRALAKGYTNVIRPMVRYTLVWNMPAVVISIGVAVYYFWNGNVQLGCAFLLTGMSMCFSGIGNIAQAFFSSTGEFNKATYFGTFRTLLPVGIILGTLLLTKNVLAVVFAYFASQILVVLITYFWSLRYVQPKSGDEFVAETKRYSVYMSALGFIMIPAQYLDQFLLWHFLGPVALATYTLAQGPAKELRTLADNASVIIFPKLAKKGAQEQVDARTIPRRTKQFFVMLAIVIFAYVVAAPILFKVFFPKYLASVFYSQLIALSVILQPRNLADTFLYAHSGLKDRYTIAIPSNIVRLIFFVVLIPPFGIVGAIAATFISELVSTGVIFYLYRRFARTNASA